MNLIQIEKLTNAKRLHRNYKVTNRDGFEFRNGLWLDDSIMEIHSDLEDIFKNAVKLYELEQKEEQALVARVRNVTLTVENDAEQGSEEWLKARIGIITASKTPFTVKGTPIPTYDDYVAQKVADAFIRNNGGVVEETYTSEAMQLGTDLEDYAIEDYEELTGRKVATHGLIVSEDYMVGASPDGVVTLDNGDRWNIEVKSVKLSTYIQQLVSNKVVNTYRTQLQVQMYILNCDRTDMVIQCQETTGQPLQTIIETVHRDEEFICNMIDTIIQYERDFKEQYALLETQIKT